MKTMMPDGYYKIYYKIWSHYDPNFLSVEARLEISGSRTKEF